MSGLQTLRTHRTLLRAVLLWFALSLGAAFAAPLVQNDAFMGQICSVEGNTVAQQDAGTPTAHGLQCVACLPFIAPPPALQTTSLPSPAHAAVQTSAPLAQTDASPASLHARGPPAQR